MSDDAFPGIGFDPAPGSLDTVASLASSLATAQQELAEALATVRQVASGGEAWQGAAAEGFAQRVGQLPQHLDTAQQSFGEAAEELESWQSQLGGMKNQARELEAQAEAARRNVQQAQGSPDLGLAGQTFTTGPELEQAERRYQAATATLNRAEAELDGLVEQAKRLLEQHRGLAESVAAAVERAAHLAPSGPGFFHRIMDGMEDLVRSQIKLAEDVGNWVKAHANAINAVGDMLATASTAVGILGCVLDCTPLAPVGAALDVTSSVLAGGALTAHLVAKAAGAPVSDTTLLEDGIGVATLGFGKSAEAVGKAAEAGTKVPGVIRAVAQGDKLSGALNAAGLSLSLKDTADNPTGLGYFVPHNTRQAAELGVGNVVAPGAGILAVGFENAWKHGSAEDREAAQARAGSGG
ncbi:hypothetical protein [Streptacidiphilus cavernicola]|uniref:WXG100 family type VII secretion target n=1 Tax=Streptacidiphilus cavernicola TaxID=3342716 RepID=A0ABV6W2H3_9ACTN